MTAKTATTKLEARTRDSGKIQLTETDVKGVVYGKKQQPISVVVERLALQRIYDHLGHSVIFNLAIEGQNDSIPVLLHDMQRKPNTNQIIHFDLYAVTMDQKIKTEVPLHLEGEAPAQADSDKTINTLLDKIEVEALPGDLPESFSVDVSALAEIGDTIHVSDLKIPSGVVILNDPESAVVKVEEVQDNAEPETEDESPTEGDAAGDEGADGQGPEGADEGKSDEASKQD